MDGNGDFQPFPITNDFESSSNWKRQPYINGRPSPGTVTLQPNLSEKKHIFWQTLAQKNLIK